MECNVAIVMMHDYLDDELPREDKIKLKEHMKICPSCQQRFDQLQRTEAFTHSAMISGLSESRMESSWRSEQAVSALTSSIMQQMPLVRRRKHGFVDWVRRHPGLTAAAVFLFVMLTSFFAMWDQGTELIVKGAGEDLQRIIIDGDTVIVPRGVQIHGDLTIENGTADIQGEVMGNLTVIDGSLKMASTAKIVGENREINQALDWLWYKVSKTVSGLAY
ncbi:zf-HC2 domain-containing protein [Paenibacillus pinihumi]|uniref:zf-HC2 domain-containing protein n=1 Tax=Paenibacillus pinihumi TaxID=669462 RepID=UPI0004060EE8|nr:zf-HC2 domain-containing protein [Paenibacillus pinihumi]